MAEVEIYTTLVCPYCQKAKRLFSKKGVGYSEIRVDTDPAVRDRMVERAGGHKTVPQIFINGTHVGGCDDLYALDHEGRLDGMLGVAPQ